MSERRAPLNGTVAVVLTAKQHTELSIAESVRPLEVAVVVDRVGACCLWPATGSTFGFQSPA